jgi:hypothetical protein
VVISKDYFRVEIHGGRREISLWTAWKKKEVECNRA